MRWEWDEGQRRRLMVELLLAGWEFDLLHDTADLVELGVWRQVLFVIVEEPW